MKALYWMGDSRRIIRELPDEVQDRFGYALYTAQLGDKHPDVKPLRGFSGAGVLEVVADQCGDTFRAVYTVRFRDAVYVLHVFQKKSNRGIKTTGHDIDRIRLRLKQAQKHHCGLLADD